MHLLSRFFFQILTALTCLLPACASQPIVFTRSRLLMGHVPVNISIKTSANQKARALAASEAAYQLASRLEAQISEFQANSEISCLNRNAGKQPCSLSPDTLELLQKAVAISAQTDHAFDIRFASNSPVGRKGEIKIYPQSSQALLSNRDTKIGISSIGKGFIVDKMVGLLDHEGFNNVLIDAGGDLMAKGGPWRVAIQVPGAKPGEYSNEQLITDRAMGSSGLYEQGHHIIDPRTGKNIDNFGGITVLADNLTLASALGTGFFVLGEKGFLKYLPNFPKIQVYWINPSGEVRVYPKLIQAVK
jgi:FAD:protein FMN transferase